MNKNYLFIAIALLAIIAIVVITQPYTLFYSNTLPEIELTDSTPTTPDSDTLAPVATTTDNANERPREAIIGRSADGTPIRAYTFGTGDTEILLLSGIHGGYAWNTALLGYELRDWLRANETMLGAVRVTIIPVINPDGLILAAGTADRFAPDQVTTDNAVRVSGRFNSNGVDLNRNFDCEWQQTGTWQDQAVSGGSAPFSEPETAAIRDYVASHRPTAAIAYYTTANGVFASTCRNGILPATNELLTTYGEAAQYPQSADFDYYEITGDMVNWLAKENIPAISVLLADASSTEFAKNIAGLQAVIQSYNAR